MRCARLAIAAAVLGASVDGFSPAAVVRRRAGPPPRRTVARAIEEAVSPTDLPPVKRGGTTSAGYLIPSLAGVKRISSVPSVVGRVTSVRVSHILLETEEMAKACLAMLPDMAFAEIARTISACADSRDKGGEIGWVSAEDTHLDDRLPFEARLDALTSQPGDVKLSKSSLGWHLIRCEDVMTELAATMERKRGRLPGTGAFGAALGAAAASADPADAAPAKTGTYAMETMGCQMNVADSERMEGQLESMGLVKTDDAKTASVVVVNTCSIRDHAEQKVYSFLGPHRDRKRKGEDLALIVAGCVAQQEGEKMLRKMPEIDLIMGPQYANRLGDLLESVSNGNQLVATEPTMIVEDITQPRRGSATCAWVNIIYGCNEHCTYCVVPHTRGVEQSRPREAIREEMVELAKMGYREVTLLGQNVDAWGRDLLPRHRFSDLLEYVSDVPGIERVRFVTSHPRYMSKRVVDVVAKHPTLCNFFHVPAQSGDDTILKDMRRGYSHARYLDIVKTIRERTPDAAISGDFIVGFPGETEEQFQRTLDLMEEVKFDSLMTASYSPRPFTPAAEWDNQVEEHVKADRLQRMQRLGNAHALERSQRYLGRTEAVLVEEVNKKRDGQVMARTDTNKLVYFDGDIAALRGKIVDVEITAVEAYWCRGRMVEGTER